MQTLLISMVSLDCNIGPLSLSNPFILASGIMDEDAGSMKRVLKQGAGAVVTKSIGMRPRMGHANPTFLELDYGILNAMGLPNPGIELFKSELLEAKQQPGIIIGSIFASTSDEFCYLAEKMQTYTADAIELNLSCPHAKGVGLEVGQDPDEIKNITQAVKNKVSIPVFVKLSPNVNNISILAKAAEKGGADAIVAINTVRAMKIDIETHRPILANKSGGYSGKAIKPIGIQNVFTIYESVSIPIIGVGGITCGIDAIEYIMAGASAVQIGSAVYYQGITIFSQLSKQVITWMKHHNYKSLNEIRGVSHR